jgi:hypothetical protein
MKRKTKFKGVVDPGKIPNTRTDNSDSDMEPDYVKKYLKPEKRIMVVTQLKLFGNPYDSNY